MSGHPDHAAADARGPDANFSMFVISPQFNGETLQPNALAYDGRSTGVMDGMYAFDDEASQPPISGANPVGAVIGRSRRSRLSRGTPRRVTGPCGSSTARPAAAPCER